MKSVSKISVVVLITTVVTFAQMPIKGLISFFPFYNGYKDLFENLTLDTVPTFVKTPIVTNDHYMNINSAYGFNGSPRAFKAIETGALPSGSQDFTISTWISKSSGGEPRVIACWGSDSNNQAKKITFYTATSAGSMDYFLGVTNGVDSLTYKVPKLAVFSSWAHVAMTVNGDTAKLFVNGEKTAEKIMIFNIQPNCVFGLGADWQDYRTPVNIHVGGIDDFAIYKRGFQDAEIKYISKCYPIMNYRPQIISKPVTTALTFKEYTYDMNITDADEHGFTVSLLEKPNGMTLTGNKISWIPNNTQIGITKVKVVVKDVAGDSIVQSFEINVEASLNNPPVITSKPDTIAKTNAQYNYAVTASDPEKEAISISLITKPTGMTLSSNKVSWTPTNAQIGKNKVKLIVKDVSGDSTEQSFEIDVKPVTSVLKTAIKYQINTTLKTVYFLPNGKMCQKIPTTKGLLVSMHSKLLIVK